MMRLISLLIMRARIACAERDMQSHDAAAFECHRASIDHRRAAAMLAGELLRMRADLARMEAGDDL